MLDLFQPPKVVPKPTRVVCQMPDLEAEKRQQRLDALRLAWAARSKDGTVQFNATRAEKLAKRRKRDAEKRRQMIGSPAHEVLKAQKRANYHALTVEQKKERQRYQREWYARRNANA